MADEDFLKKLGKSIARIRKKRGLTQQEVANVLQLTVGGYMKYEYGERNMPITTFYTLADYFHVSADEILGRTEPDDPIESLCLTDDERSLVRVFVETDEDVRHAFIEFVKAAADRCVPDAPVAEDAPPA